MAPNDDTILARLLAEGHLTDSQARRVRAALERGLALDDALQSVPLVEPLHLIRLRATTAAAAAPPQTPAPPPMRRELPEVAAFPAPSGEFTPLDDEGIPFLRELYALLEEAAAGAALEVESERALFYHRSGKLRGARPLDAGFASAAMQQLRVLARLAAWREGVQRATVCAVLAEASITMRVESRRDAVLVLFEPVHR